MKYLIIAVVLVSACKNSHTETSMIDSIQGMPTKEWEEKWMDSVRKKTDHDIYMDTAGLYNAPVKVLSAKFTSKEYSNYKDIRLSYKNVTSKKIDGIKFKWYALNTFGDPADAGGYANGFGGGFDDEGLAPGRSTSSTWNILSKDGKKVVLAWPYEVVFSDGSKWKLGE